MSYPKVIRANPKRLKYQVLRNGEYHEATPPTYILFGVDDEGKGIYRCNQGAGIILIDDCPEGSVGKGKLSIPYLLQKGYQTILHDYQMILK